MVEALSQQALRPSSDCKIVLALVLLLESLRAKLRDCGGGRRARHPEPRRRSRDLAIGLLAPPFVKAYSPERQGDPSTPLRYAQDDRPVVVASGRKRRACSHVPVGRAGSMLQRTFRARGTRARLPPPVAQRRGYRCGSVRSSSPDQGRPACNVSRRNGAVRLMRFFATSSGVPTATISPPAAPASGPISTT